MGFDAVTLHPYLGRESLAPFIERRDKVSLILCRTSNPGAGDLQDLLVEGRPLWQVVAEKVTNEWNLYGNLMMVVGATYPGEMRRIREVSGDLTFLVPGVGAQGGEVQAVAEAGLNSHNMGLIISSSRGIISAPDPGEAARALRDESTPAGRLTRSILAKLLTNLELVPYDTNRWGEPVWWLRLWTASAKRLFTT